MAELERLLQAKWDENAKSMAEVRKEVQDKATEASMLASALMAAGHFELGASALGRAWFLFEWAKELAQPPKIVIIVT